MWLSWLRLKHKFIHTSSRTRFRESSGLLIHFYKMGQTYRQYTIVTIINLVRTHIIVYIYIYIYTISIYGYTK